MQNVKIISLYLLLSMYMPSQKPMLLSKYRPKLEDKQTVTSAIGGQADVGGQVAPVSHAVVEQVVTIVVVAVGGQPAVEDYGTFKC